MPELMRILIQSFFHFLSVFYKQPAGIFNRKSRPIFCPGDKIPVRCRRYISAADSSVPGIFVLRSPSENFSPISVKNPEYKILIGHQSRIIDHFIISVSVRCNSIDQVNDCKRLLHFFAHFGISYKYMMCPSWYIVEDI